MIKVNHQIQAKELRVIDEKGVNFGVLSLEAALQMAREKGLDLIEISPMTNPPVARIMAFDKYRYQEEKKLKKQKSQQRNQQSKQIRISGRATEHDLQIKVVQIERFLKEDNTVEIQLTLKGREKAHKEWGRQKLLNFMKLIKTEYKIISEIKYGNYGFTIRIAKK